LKKPPKRSGLESKFLCFMIWIATGLIPSSVNWVFTCYRTNQREIIRHLKMFLFHPFLNIWYFLSDIPIDTLSDSCSAASDYLRQTWYHCSFGFTRKSLKCLVNIAGLLKIHTCPIREFWSNLTNTTIRRWMSDNIGAMKTRIQRLQSSNLNMRDLIESISAEDEDAMWGRDLFLEVHEDNLDMYLWAEQKKLICILLGKWCHFLSHFSRWTKNVMIPWIQQMFRSKESLESWSTPRSPYLIYNSVYWLNIRWPNSTKYWPIFQVLNQQNNTLK